MQTLFTQFKIQITKLKCYIQLMQIILSTDYLIKLNILIMDDIPLLNERTFKLVIGLFHGCNYREMCGYIVEVQLLKKIQTCKVILPKIKYFDSLSNLTNYSLEQSVRNLSKLHFWSPAS